MQRELGGEATTGEGSGKSIEDTASTSSSEHGDGFKLQAREQCKKPKEKGFKRFHESLETTHFGKAKHKEDSSKRTHRCIKRNTTGNST
jgi:hypothetical protein